MEGLQMAKMDTKNRLQIPSSLINELHLSSKVGIFWDTDEKSIYLSDLTDCSNEFCLEVRHLDSKKRVTISERLLNLIDSDYSSLFVIALRKNRIYIFNRDSQSQSM